jgi:hemerythrin
VTNETEWKEEYNIGISRIDHQHRYFFELINWLTNNLLISDNPDLKRGYVEEIIWYAKFHFFSEENVMQCCNYPGFEAHKDLHAKIINQLNVEVANLDFGEKTINDFANFLREWFFNHTIREDKEISLYLEKCNLKDAISC